MRSRAWLAVAVDIVWVLVFVVIGRASHTKGEALGGIASTAWPFLAGLAAGWLVLFLLWHPVLLWHRAREARPLPAFGVMPAGVVAWLATVAVGMTLRVVCGQGTDVAFTAVALAFLGLFLLGWRLLLRGAALLAPRKLRRPLHASYPPVMPFPASSSCPRQWLR
ncbi:MAG: putative rane protein [Actinomycetia bacterium]|nr:putative rane protein [Actinomycetes bacterium]